MNTFFGWFTKLFGGSLVLRAPIRSPEREAILLTADFLTKNPERYDFMEGRLKEPTGWEPACALAWIGTFSGNKYGDYHDVAERFLKIPPQSQCNGPCFTFYERLEELDDPKYRGYARWMDSPFHLVTLLRAYADRYYPEVG